MSTLDAIKQLVKNEIEDFKSAYYDDPKTLELLDKVNEDKNVDAIVDSVMEDVLNTIDASIDKKAVEIRGDI